MFIRICIKLVPIFLIGYTFGSTIDSTKFYLDSGLLLEKQGKLALSGQHYKKAIEFTNDKFVIADLYNNMGIVYRKQSKYNLALDSYQIAQAISQDSTIRVKVYANIATIHQMKGDFNKALLFNRKALSLVKNKSWTASILNNIANVLSLSNDYESAIQYYKESIKLKKEYDLSSISYAYLNIALCLIEINKLEDAEFYFQKTIQERIKFLGRKHYRLIKAYTNYGNFLKQRSPQKALQLLKQANDIAISKYGYKHSETAKTYYYLGNYFLVNKLYKQALAKYQEALISNSNNFNSKIYSQNPDISNAFSELRQLDILHQKAITLQNYGNSIKDTTYLHTSLITYELTIRALFKLQNSFMDESKRTLISNKKDMFAEAAYIAIQLNQYSKAFQLIEKGKASTLLAAVNNNEAIQFSDIPDSLVKLENEYKRLQFVYTANNNTDSVLFYQAKYDSLVSYFETNYKKYHNLKYGNEFPDPCKQLDTNQILLEYALTDTLCITLLASKEGYRHHIFPIDSTFNYSTKSFIRQLREMKYFEGYQEQYDTITACGYYLWEKLIKPLHIPDNKSLIIIPDGILSYLNFETLLYSQPIGDDINYITLKYLLHKHPISYSYSASWLFEPYNGNPKKKIIAFAADYRDKQDFMTLQSSIPEAKEITKFNRGKRYINNACTKEAFFTHAPDYEIIHLSLHGDIDTNNTHNSKLRFYDNDLYSWEVYGMNLNARMAYLSACKSGDGQLDKGEGIFSMGRAFAYAGCPTIIMSLWTDKDNMPHLILDYYKYLRKGYPLDKAMQLAKINHLKLMSEAPPHFWANKIIMGKTTPIKSEKNYYWMFLLLVIPLIYYFYKKRST